jgi:hypothetical protein
LIIFFYSAVKVAYKVLSSILNRYYIGDIASQLPKIDARDGAYNIFLPITTKKSGPDFLERLYNRLILSGIFWTLTIFINHEKLPQKLQNVLYWLPSAIAYS